MEKNIRKLKYPRYFCHVFLLHVFLKNHKTKSARQKVEESLMETDVTLSWVISVEKYRVKPVFRGHLWSKTKGGLLR